MFLFSLQDNESLEYRNSILFTFESHNVQDYHNVQIYYNPDQEIPALLVPSLLKKNKILPSISQLPKFQPYLLIFSHM